MLDPGIESNSEETEQTPSKFYSHWKRLISEPPIVKLSASPNSPRNPLMCLLVGTFYRHMTAHRADLCLSNKQKDEAVEKPGSLVCTRATISNNLTDAPQDKTSRSLLESSSSVQATKAGQFLESDQDAKHYKVVEDADHRVAIKMHLL